MVKYIKQFNLDTPSWEEVLNDLNFSSLNKELIKIPSPGFFVSHHSYRIPKVSKILKTLKLSEAHSYINILGNSPTFGEHKDNVDVWFWQVKGSTKWIIENSKEYSLEEGDLIYIPQGISHNVIPHGPRIGISMSL